MEIQQDAERGTLLRKVYGIHRHTKLRYSPLPPLDERQDSVTLLGLVARLAQTEYVMAEKSALWQRSYKLGHVINPGHEDTGSNRLFLLLTEDQAAALEELVIFLRRFWKAASQEGERRGTHFLMQMAENRLSIEDINKKVVGDQ
jgi:hypothetical protein